jgi:hypothetical protein
MVPVDKHGKEILRDEKGVEVEEINGEKSEVNYEFDYSQWEEYFDLRAK